MRILQLCLKPPYPQIDGGCIAMASITSGLLNQGNEVRLLCATTHKHPWQQSKWPNELVPKTSHVQIDTTLKPLAALANIVGKGSYNVNRFFDEALNLELVRVLKEFSPQIVIAESLFMMPYLKTIKNESKAKVILRAHNVEHLIWQRLSENSTSIIKSKYLKFLAERLKIYELEVLDEVDAITVLSQEDEVFFKQHTSVPVRTIPIGLNLSELPLNQPKANPTLFHLGAMNWQPNAEAIHFFVNEVWPLVTARTPQAKCILAGREMPESLITRSTEKLQIMSDVDDANVFFAENDIMVLPLLSGGGMRVKLLEAMAMRKVVISTTVGAEGVPGKHGVHFLLADTAQEMADIINECYTDKWSLAKIGTAARQLMEEKFSNEAISKDLSYFCEQVAIDNGQ